MVPFSVCHVLFARVMLSSPAVLSCPFSYCAVRAPSSSLPAELTRPLLLLHVLSCSGCARRQLITPLPRALSGARHILIPPVSSTSLCVVSLDRSVAFPVQSLQRTEFIRHIFLIRFLSFISFFLFSSSSLAQSTKIWRGY